jgi:hypothetical protein
MNNSSPRKGKLSERRGRKAKGPKDESLWQPVAVCIALHRLSHSFAAALTYGQSLWRATGKGRLFFVYGVHANKLPQRKGKNRHEQKLAMNTTMRLLALCLVLLLITAFSPRPLGAGLEASDGGDLTNLVFQQIEAAVQANGEGTTARAGNAPRRRSLRRCRPWWKTPTRASRSLSSKHRTAKGRCGKAPAPGGEHRVASHEKAAKNGFEIECDYVTCIVDGQSVLIDPLRVVIRR